MKVKYIKDGVSAKIGAVRTMTDVEARVLIKLGIVVPFEQQNSNDKKTAKRQPKKGEVFGQSTKVKKDETTKSTKRKRKPKADK